MQDPLVSQLAYLQRLLSDSLDREEEARQRERAALMKVHELEQRLASLSHGRPDRRYAPWANSFSPDVLQQERPRPPPPPPLEKAEDTPAANAYIDRQAELDEAFRERKSLAIPGALVKFVEHVQDLCEAPEAVKFHAIGADARCGVGVAKDIVEAVGERPTVPDDVAIGSVIEQEAGDLGTVCHVVTKKKSTDKLHMNPEEFIKGAQKGYKAVADVIRREKLKEVAISYMCSGSDRLHRLWTMELLYRELKDVPVTVHFYGKYFSRRWNGAGRLFEQQSPHEGEEAEEKETAPKDFVSRPSTSRGRGSGRGRGSRM
jgi:hypothetical protein